MLYPYAIGYCIEGIAIRESIHEDAPGQTTEETTLIVVHAVSPPDQETGDDVVQVFVAD